MHTIQSVAERTGLTPDVIRIWERRYQAVSHRTAANQRLYSEDDVERLDLLKRVTDGGRRISAVANLSNTELRDMLAQQPPSPPRRRCVAMAATVRTLPAMPSIPSCSWTRSGSRLSSTGPCLTWARWVS